MKIQNIFACVSLKRSALVDDFAVPPTANLGSASTASRESTPSGDTLTQQMRHISQQWREAPVSVPEHVAEEFTSPSADTGETPSSASNGTRETSSSSGADHKSGEGKVLVSVERVRPTHSWHP